MGTVLTAVFTEALSLHDSDFKSVVRHRPQSLRFLFGGQSVIAHQSLSCV